MRDNLAGRCTKLPVACDFSSDTMLRFIAWIVKTMNIYIEFATRRNFENSEKERYKKMRIFVHSKHFMIITIEKKKKKVGINNEMGELMKLDQFSGEDALLVEFEEMGFDRLQLLLPWSPKKRFKFNL